MNKTIEETLKELDILLADFERYITIFTSYLKDKEGKKACKYLDKLDKVEWDIKDLFKQALQKAQEEAEKDKAEILEALGGMWNQYCGKDGHSFMNAGEQASVVLMKYGMLKDEWSEAEDEYLKTLNKNEK